MEAPLDPSQAVFVYANSSGQLTLTQNTPIPTGAEDLSFIYASPRYIYLIDAGQSVNPSGVILPYTIGTNGALQSLVGGAVNNSGTVANPGPMIVDHKASSSTSRTMGPNLNANQPVKFRKRILHRPDYGQIDDAVRRSKQDQHYLWLRILSTVHS